jgi:DNA-binding transcriptional ArsR family regulator
VSSDQPPVSDGPPVTAPEAAELNPRKLTDPRAMRALAHPVRMALLEALAHAGTLTATQASDLLGESPANCAFHLRTLAKYGYVEEAGGGRGRERPWRRVHETLDITTNQADLSSAMAARELTRFWVDMMLERARTALSQEELWPAGFRHRGLGMDQYLTYLTAEEAHQLSEDAYRLFLPFFERVDRPERRPAGAIPVEVLLLGYPLLHLAARPEPVPGPPSLPSDGDQSS